MVTASRSIAITDLIVTRAVYAIAELHCWFWWNVGIQWTERTVHSFSCTAA